MARVPERIRRNGRVSLAFDMLAAKERIDTTVEALKARGISAECLETKDEVLARVRALIPAGASLSTGASLTLKEIGFEDLLKSGSHPWKNLKAEYLAEKDRWSRSFSGARVLSRTTSSEASTRFHRPGKSSSPA